MIRLAKEALNGIEDGDMQLICEAYEIDGRRTTSFPSHVQDLAKAKPVFRTLPGWKTDVSGIRKLEDFPSETRHYLDTLGELVGARVEIVSIGPDREQTVFCNEHQTV